MLKIISTKQQLRWIELDKLFENARRRYTPSAYVPLDLEECVALGAGPLVTQRPPIDAVVDVPTAGRQLSAPRPVEPPPVPTTTRSVASKFSLPPHPGAGAPLEPVMHVGLFAKPAGPPPVPAEPDPPPMPDDLAGQLDESRPVPRHAAPPPPPPPVPNAPVMEPAPQEESLSEPISVAPDPRDAEPAPRDVEPEPGPEPDPLEADDVEKPMDEAPASEPPPVPDVPAPDESSAPADGPDLDATSELPPAQTAPTARQTRAVPSHEPVVPTRRKWQSSLFSMRSHESASPSPPPSPTSDHRARSAPAAELGEENADNRVAAALAIAPADSTDSDLDLPATAADEIVAPALTHEVEDEDDAVASPEVATAPPLIPSDEVEEAEETEDPARHRTEPIASPAPDVLDEDQERAAPDPEVHPPEPPQALTPAAPFVSRPVLPPMAALGTTSEEDTSSAGAPSAAAVPLVPIIPAPAPVEPAETPAPQAPGGPRALRPEQAPQGFASQVSWQSGGTAHVSHVETSASGLPSTIGNLPGVRRADDVPVDETGSTGGETGSQGVEWH